MATRSATLQELAEAKTRVEEAIGLALSELEHEYGIRVTAVQIGRIYNISAPAAVTATMEITL